MKLTLRELGWVVYEIYRSGNDVYLEKHLQFVNVYIIGKESNTNRFEFLSI